MLEARKLQNATANLANTDMRLAYLENVEFWSLCIMSEVHSLQGLDKQELTRICTTNLNTALSSSSSKRSVWRHKLPNQVRV